MGSVDLWALHGLSPLDLLLRLGVATLLGALIGLERERLERAAGLRTNALVCVASSLIMVVSIYGFADSDVLDPSRIAAQVVSGVGFLGAGVIIFRKNTVRGLTTAASLWAVAGVGLAAGCGLYIPAAAGTAFMLLIQAGLRPIEARFFEHQDTRHRIMIEIDDASALLTQLAAITGHHGARVQTMQFERNEDSDVDLVEVTVRMDQRDNRFAMIDELRRVPGVRRVVDARGVSGLRRTGRSGIGFENDNGDDDEDETR